MCGDTPGTHQSKTKPPLPSVPPAWSGTPPAECAAKGCCHAPSPSSAGDAVVSLPTCFHANGGASAYAADGGVDVPAKGKLTQVRERVCVCV